MSPNHPRTNDIETILVKKPVVENLAAYLWREINTEDTPPGDLLDWWDELEYAQTRHKTPGFFDGDLVVADLDDTTGPATLWEITNSTETETVDGTPTVIYHAQSPANKDIETTFDPEHLTAAADYDGEFVTPTRE